MFRKNTLKSKDNSIKDIVWNMAGSISSAMTSVVLLMIVSRILNDYESGIFAIAFSISQIMLTISYFELRTYQVTDVLHKYSFDEYLATRILTTAAMIIISYLYIHFFCIDSYKSTMIFIFCMYRTVDGVSDIFQGHFQLNGKLYLAGKMMALQNICSVIGFAILIILTENLILSSVILGVIYIAVLVIFLFKYRIDINKITQFPDIKKIVGLIKESCPLFFGTFMYIYILNSSKYAIDILMDERSQLIYNVILMPAFTINLCAGFMLRPLMTRLSLLWKEKEYSKFKRILKINYIYIMILTIIVVIIGKMIGMRLLSWMYSMDLYDYMQEFIVILIGGGINALIVMLYYVLIVFRKQKEIFYGYLLSFFLAVIFSFVMVDKFGITGASITYTLSLFVLLVVYLFFTYNEIVKNEIIIYE